jgi:hypothetical protein
LPSHPTHTLLYRELVWEWGCGIVIVAELGASLNLSLSLYIIGIGNCSETIYIRSFVHYLLSNGHTVAVLNHVGTLGDVPVTGNRLFTYGKMR